MTTVVLKDLLTTTALVTRPSARLLEKHVESAAESNGVELAFDLDEKMAMAPSFFDEMLRIVDEQSSTQDRPIRVVELLNVPSTLSTKFHAVCRSHGMILSEVEPGHWRISRR